MSDIRVYFAIRAQTASAPTEAQWRALLQDAAHTPGALLGAVVEDARRRGDRPHNRLSASKRSQNPAQLRRWTLAAFEFDREDTDAALALLDALAATRAISGAPRQKVERVLQAEIREAAQRQGFTPAQAALFSVQVAAFGGRAAARAEVQAYLAASPAVWSAAP